MPDDFGIIPPVGAPILERVSRDERLGRDNPRRQGEKKPEKTHQHADEISSQGGDQSPAPSTHVDLRI